MKNNKYNFIFSIIGFCGFFYILYIFFFIFIDYGFLNSQITAYPISCFDYMTKDELDYRLEELKDKKASQDKIQKVIDIYVEPNEKTCKKYKAQKPIVFKVNIKEQYVIDGDLNRLKDCVILDRKNWTCDADLFNTRLGFSKGIFFQGYESDPFIFVSKFQWWKLDKAINL